MKEKIYGKLIVTSYESSKFHKEKVSYPVAYFFVDNKPEYIKVIPAENTLPAGSIVTGKVTNVVPNIPAAFVSLNQAKDMGFLSLKNLEHVLVTNRIFNGKLQSGDEVVVKIEREPMKTKEATLTALFDMTSCYAAARMGSGRLFFSKKLSQRQKDAILAYLVSRAVVTRDMQLIGIDNIDVTIRTEAGKILQEAGETDKLLLDDTFHMFLQDIEQTVRALQQFMQQALTRTCYTVHQRPITWLTEVWNELSLCGYAIEEYVTDDFAILNTLKELVPEKEAHKIRFYQDNRISLSSLYSLKVRLDELQQTKVWLPCGGYLCIEPTEAMTVIDVNSGKAIRNAKDSEQLFLETNKEAAKEIARQLRLRNLSGIIVVDYINMKSREAEREILALAKEYARADFSPVTVYDFTRLGLLEMTRNKKSKALHEIF